MQVKCDYCEEITNLIYGSTRRGRFQRASSSLTSADNLFTELRNEGVQFHRTENDGSHLRSWLGALQAYNHDFITS